MKRVLSLGDITGGSSNVAIDDDDDGSFTQVRRHRNKKPKKTEAAQKQPNTSVSSQRKPTVPVSQSATVSDQSSSSPELSELSTLRKTVDELRETVHSYKQIINDLTAQLNFVTNYLGINDHWPAVGSTVAASADGTIATGATTATATATVAAANAAATTTTAVTYAGVAATACGPKSQPPSLKEVVAAAVHADRRDKERRAKTVIVSGLMQCSDMTDVDCFRRLTMLELGVDLQVKFAKRLGTAVSDRVQPLLIGLQSANEATGLVLKAKQLRSSTDEQVRRNVFINRNLSPVEAKFAYEERCRRRHRRSQQQHADRHLYVDVQRPQLSQAQGAVGSQSDGEPDQSHPARVIVNSQLRRDQQHSDGSDAFSQLSPAYSQPSVSVIQQDQVGQQAVYQAGPRFTLPPSSSSGTSTSAVVSAVTPVDRRHDGRHR